METKNGQQTQEFFSNVTNGTIFRLTNQKYTRTTCYMVLYWNRTNVIIILFDKINNKI